MKHYQTKLRRDDGPHERITMRSTLALALLVSCLAAIVSAQSPASSFPRGNSQQAWQNPGLPTVLETCKVKPPAFAIKPSVGEKEANAEPRYPATQPPTYPIRSKRIRLTPVMAVLSASLRNDGFTEKSSGSRHLKGTSVP